MKKLLLVLLVIMIGICPIESFAAIKSGGFKSSSSSSSKSSSSKSSSSKPNIQKSAPIAKPDIQKSAPITKPDVPAVKSDAPAVKSDVPATKPNVQQSAPVVQPVVPSKSYIPGIPFFGRNNNANAPANYNNTSSMGYVGWILLIIVLFLLLVAAKIAYELIVAKRADKTKDRWKK